MTLGINPEKREGLERAYATLAAAVAPLGESSAELALALQQASALLGEGAAVPQESKAEARKVALGVASEDARLVMGGPFASLDADLTANILARVPLRSRLDCLYGTCKGWRSLRGRDDVWADITADLTAGYNEKRECISIAGLMRLLELEAVRAGVRRLCIQLPADINKAKALAKRIKGALPNLETLEWSHNNSSDALIKVLADSVAAMPKLTELRVPMPTGSDATILRLLVAKPAIQRLQIGDAGSWGAMSWMSYGLGGRLILGLEGLEKWVEGVSEKRDGGAPVIEELTTTLSSGALMRLGTALPELRSLRAKCINSSLAMPSRVGAVPFESLKLRVLALTTVDMLPDAFMGHLATSACESTLEELELSASKSQMYLSKKEIAARIPVMPIWAPPDTFTRSFGLFTKLRSLKLALIRLEPDALDGCVFDALQTLHIKQCGARAGQALAAASMPKLRVLVADKLDTIDNVFYDGTSGEGVKALARLDSTQLQELSLNCCGSGVPDFIQALARSPLAATLRRLKLSNALQAGYVTAAASCGSRSSTKRKPPLFDAPGGVHLPALDTLVCEACGAAGDCGMSWSMAYNAKKAPRTGDATADANADAALLAATLRGLDAPALRSLELDARYDRLYGFDSIQEFATFVEAQANTLTMRFPELEELRDTSRFKSGYVHFMANKRDGAWLVTNELDKSDSVTVGTAAGAPGGAAGASMSGVA